MNVTLSALVAALMIARANGDLYMVYRGQQTVIVSSDSTVIAAENVGSAILEVTQEEDKPDFGLLQFDQITPDEISRLHPNLLQHLDTQQLLELSGKSRQKVKTEEKIAPRIRRLRDWLAEALAGKAPTTLGEENMSMVQKLVSDPLKMHPMTALLRKGTKFTPRQLRKIFGVRKIQLAKKNEDFDRFDKLINSVVEAYLSARDHEELYRFLSTFGLPEPLASNERIAEYIKEYEEYFADHGDLEEEEEDVEGDGQRTDKWSFVDLKARRHDYVSEETPAWESGSWSKARSSERKQSDEEDSDGESQRKDDRKQGPRRTVMETGKISLEEAYGSTGMGKKKTSSRKPTRGKEDRPTTTSGDLSAASQLSVDQSSVEVEGDKTSEHDSSSRSSSVSSSQSSALQIPTEITLKDPPPSIIKGFTDLIGQLFRRKPRKPVVTTPSVPKVPVDQHVEITYEEASTPSTAATTPRKPVLSRWPHQTRKTPQTRGGKETGSSKNDGEVVEQWSYVTVRKNKKTPQSDDQEVVSGEDRDEEESDSERSENWEEVSLSSSRGKKDSGDRKKQSKEKQSSIKSPKVLDFEESDEAEGEVGDEGTSGAPSQHSNESGDDSDKSGEGSQQSEDKGDDQSDDDESEDQEDEAANAESSHGSGLSEGDGEAKGDEEGEEDEDGRQSERLTEAGPSQEDESFEGEDSSEAEEPSTSDGEYERVARQVTKHLKKLEKGRKRRQTLIKELSSRRDTLREELAATEEELQERQNSLEKFIAEAQDGLSAQQSNDETPIKEGKTVTSGRPAISSARRRKVDSSEQWTMAFSSGASDYSSPYKPKHHKGKSSGTLFQ